uniref:Protochlorophyllide reductase n=1 Tax=Prasinoderma coloniale TaxID=156133 RepID=A0A7R9TWK0_9VIRI|mmetsp:Transcript_7422/g.30165  ORF Transcript_7422/g.30165 Transcript_7422/m.30165 type:complete len:258 (+) Transcript_7422:107-880(+)
MHVVLVCRRESTGQSALDALQALGGACSLMAPADLACTDVAERIAAQVEAQVEAGTLPPLLALVNNAGVLPGRMDERAAAEANVPGVCDALHVRAVTRLSRALLPTLGRTHARSPRVVTVGSFTHRAASARAALPARAYSRSKLGGVAVTLALDEELRVRSSTGARVRCVVADPGAVRTALTRAWPRWLVAAFNGVFARAPERAVGAVIGAVLSECLEGGEYLYGPHAVPLSPSRRAQAMAHALAEDALAALARGGQ